MNNVFDFAEACLHRSDITEKLQLTADVWQLYLKFRGSKKAKLTQQPIELKRKKAS
jgi:hypothetical protein